MITNKVLQEIIELEKKATPIVEEDHHKFDHGGSRLFKDGKSGERQLIADFYDADNRDYFMICRNNAVSMAKEIIALREIVRNLQ